MKKMPNRQYIVLKADFTYLRGYFVSPATMERYSGPTMVKAPTVKCVSLVLEQKTW